MLEVFSYGFMQKAFITGIVIAVACSLLGVFLVLRRYALIGDGLAHISFGGVAAGMLFNYMPFASALLFAVLGSLGILKLKEKTLMHSDTAIAIISYTSLGAGIFIATAAGGFNVELMSYLFGSILAIQTFEVLLSTALALIVISVIVLFYNELFFLTFDEESAKTSGVNTGLLNSLLVVLTAITVVSAMRVTGLLLASALIVLPAASALQYRASFRKTLILSAAIAVFSVTAGLLAAYYYDYAVSGSIILINAFVFLLSLLLSSIKRKT
jgi:zinc transport system permease protein